jgi:serine phosphatase RsbU (regulator of sigma subunit)
MTTFRSSARGLPMAVFARHLLPCLLIPWTLRESIRPAVVLVVLVACVMTVDAFRGDVPVGLAISYTLGSAVAAAPGAVLCWLRHSRYRRDFTLRFESALYRRLHTELSGARQVHESCLPPPLAEGPVRLSYAYEPMRQIGGDLLFVHPPPPRERVCAVDLPDGAVLPVAPPFPPPAPSASVKADTPVSAVILDVTGHGIAAALMVNRMVGELERLFAENAYARPGDVLAALNRYVHLTLARSGLFATALCLRVNPARGLIEWASGGNPPAYLRRPDGRIRTLSPTAAMLGILDPSEYDPAPDQLPFAEGDVVLAYTDGAFESADASGNPLGTGGVARLLGAVASEGLEPEQYAGAMLARIAAHRGGAPEDDTLLVVISRAPVTPEQEKEPAQSSGRGEEVEASAAGVPTLPQDPTPVIPVGKKAVPGARYSAGPAVPGGAGAGPGPGAGPGLGAGAGAGVGPGRGAPPPGGTGAGEGDGDVGDGDPEAGA